MDKYYTVMYIEHDKSADLGGSSNDLEWYSV